LNAKSLWIKSPRAAIYIQVKKDLIDAIAGLPARGAVKQNFRVSNATAQALLGKVLVFEGKYSDAIPYLAVISNPAYGLEATCRCMVSKIRVW
jgi:hypothetical protein